MSQLATRFEDSIAFTGAIQAQGWQAELRQLDRGTDNTSVLAVQGSDFSLMRVEFGNRVHQRALPPEGQVVFGLPTGPQAPGLFGRRPLESESLYCFHPDDGMSAICPAGFSAFTASVSEERLAQLADAVGLVDSAAIRPAWGAQCRPDELALARLRRYLDSAISVLAGGAPAQACNAGESIGSDFLLALLQAFQHGQPQPYVRCSNRHRALRRALTYIDQHAQTPLSVEELCRESAASISTLERAFREHFGVSPKRYLVASRLNRVRQVLARGEDERSIADIAAQWGFWHMSKFAADYKRMFGELPSQTRRDSAC